MYIDIVKCFLICDHYLTGAAVCNLASAPAHLAWISDLVSYTHHLFHMFCWKFGPV